MISDMAFALLARLRLSVALCALCVATVPMVSAGAGGSAGTPDSADASGPRDAGTGTARRARLEATLNDWQSLRANFLQTVVGDDGGVIERSRGVVEISRPGRFRWHYEVPFSQLIVSGGDDVYIYDEDLAQVTVGTIDGTADDPAAQLLEDRVPIDALFELDWLADENGLEWARLTPRAEGATYRRVDVGMQGTSLKRLKLADQFGQTTILEFDDVERDPSLDPARFDFEPPEGVDVVRMRE